MNAPVGYEVSDLSQPVAPDGWVSEAMLADPTVFDPSILVGRLRELFENRHVHMVLLVERGRLISAVERSDLDRPWPAYTTGSTIGTLRGRTIAPDVPLAEARRLLDLSGGRRLAVIGNDGELLGLLCLKSSRAGFCSAEDVLEHREDVRAQPAHAAS